MELTARLVQVLPLQSGVSKTGNSWQRQSFVLETDGQYAKKVCFSMFGQPDQNKPDMTTFAIGTMLTVSFDPESREFQGRWYTDLRAWKVVEASATTVAPNLAMPQFGMNNPLPQQPVMPTITPTNPSQDQVQLVNPIAPPMGDSSSDDLPF